MCSWTFPVNDSLVEGSERMDVPRTLTKIGRAKPRPDVPTILYSLEASMWTAVGVMLPIIKQKLPRRHQYVGRGFFWRRALMLVNSGTVSRVVDNMREHVVDWFTELSRNRRHLMLGASLVSRQATSL